MENNSLYRGRSDQAAADDALGPVYAAPIPPQKPPQRPPFVRSKLFVNSLVLLILTLLVAVGGFFVINRSESNDRAAQPSGQYEVQDIPLDDITDDQMAGLSTSQSLSVNGQLRANNSLILTPGQAPVDASQGQIYFDESSTALAYYNGSSFVGVANSDQIEELQTQIDSVESSVPETAGVPVGVAIQGGNNVFEGNNEFTTTINGTNLSLSDSATIADDLTVSGSTNLGPTTISSLILSSPLGVSSGGTGRSSLTNNGVVIGQGTAALATVTASSPGLCLVSTSGAPAFQSCSGSGSGVNDLNGLNGSLSIANASGAGSVITIDDASTSTKGIARFNATNFSVSSGVVNTIQNLAVSSTPTFAGLNLSAPLSVANGGTGANTLTTNGVILGNGTSALSSLTAGSAGQCLVSTAGAPTFASCPGASGVASLNGLNGALSLNNASGSGSSITINDASTAAKGIASFNSTNFTASSGAVNTVQNINTSAAPTFAGLTVTGTLNTNTLTPSNNLTIGSTLYSLSLQGNSSTSLAAINGSNTTALTFQSPTANVTYRLQTAAAGTYDVCTTVGNCAGVGGGVTTPGGTNGRIAKFTGAQTLADSLLSESGSVVTVNGTLGVNTITPTGTLTVGSTAQMLILQGDASTRVSATSGGITNSLLFSTPSGSNKSITLPNASGTVAVSAAGPLSLDSSGNVTCPTCVTSGGGSGGAAAVDSLNGQTGAVTLNNASGSGSTVTIDNASTAAKGIASFNSTNFSVLSGAVNTIQNISTSSTPTFNALNLSTALSVGNGGTGSTTASGARSNLGAAASGANGDITSLTGLTTALSVTQGGTGGVTSQAAINNLSQLTTNGDLLYYDGSNSTRLARGSNGQCLTSNATTLQWGACGITAEADTLASVTGRGATTSTGLVLQGGATIRGLNIDTATATDDSLSLSVTSGGASSFTGTITASDLTAARTWTLPDASGTFCLQGSSTCGFAGSSGSSGYIQNQNASQQASSNFWISGTGRADTALQAPSIDTSLPGGSLSIGATNAGTIDLYKDVYVAGGKGITLVGGNTASRPASPSEGTVYYDTTTKKLLVYSNGKWQADRSSATRIVGTSASGGTSGAVASVDPDGADYVNTSTTAANTTINAALTSLPASGGTVYLMEGTYVVSTSVSMPNNTKLVGAGKGTVIKLVNAIAAFNPGIRNTDTSTGAGIEISNLSIDANKANQGTTNGVYGIQLDGMGGGSGVSARQGAKISNVTVLNSLRNNVFIDNSSNGMFTNITSQGSDDSGFFVSGTSGNNSFTNNMAQGNGESGFAIEADNNTLNGNTAQGNTDYGFFADGAGISFNNNIALSNSSIGFYTFSANNIVINNNISRSNGSYGIYVRAAHYSTVSGNTVMSNSSDGIKLFQSASNNTITGNAISSNTAHGIFIDSSLNNTVSSNSLYDNGGTGSSSGIMLDAADTNTITSNRMVDTAGTGHAINVSNSTSDNNYLSDNNFSGTGNTTLNDAGTGTIYANQLNSSGNMVSRGIGAASINTSTVTSSLTLQGGLSNSQLPAPGQPSIVTVGTAGTYDYTYGITALDGTGETTISTTQLIATGNQNLTGSNYNRITWTRVPGAVQYRVYRTAVEAGSSDATLGLIGTVTGASTFDDTGIVASGSAPGSNNTGGATFAGLLQAPSLDTASAGTLTLGATNATSISIAQNTVLAAGKSLRITGDTTANRPSSPTEGMLFYDTSTKQLLTYANGKWQADRSDAVLVAASNSSDADKAAADYVGDGSTATANDGDQIQINNALTAASGKKVIMLAGTYIIDESIRMPNNTTLAGVGRGTYIEFADTDLGDNAIENIDTSTGTGITLQDFRMDGRKDLNLSGLQYGIFLSAVGGGSGTTTRKGATINNVAVSNFNYVGFQLQAINNTKVTNSMAFVNGGSGFVVNNGGTGNIIEGNVSQANTDTGIFLDGISYSTVTGNVVRSSGLSGFNIRDVTYSTITGNTTSGNTQRGMYIDSADSNTFSGNSIDSNNQGIYFTTSAFSNTVTGNKLIGNANESIFSNSSSNTLNITGNYVSGGTIGVYLGPGSNSVVSSNTITGTSSYGVQLNTSTGVTINDNRIFDSGGTTTNNAIYLQAADDNTVTDNSITDASATTNNYSINVFNSTSDRNILSGNNLGTGSINDSGTGTIYNGQRDGNGNYLNNATSSATFNTSTVSSSLSLQGGLSSTQLPAPAQPSIVTVGTAGTYDYTYGITALDGTGETTLSTTQLIATGNQNLTGSNFNRVSWTKVPGAIQYKVYRTAVEGGSSDATTGLVGTITGGSTLTFDDTGIVASGSTPGSNTTGGATIAGSLQGSVSVLSPLFDRSTAGTLSVGTATATAITVGRSGVLTTIAGTLTVSEAATFSGNLTVNGHIISGGSTPGIAAGTAACASPTVSMAGTDTSGTITVTTGTGCSAGGKLATITFATAFGAAPHITITPTSTAAAGLTTFVDFSTISTTTFDINTTTTPADSTTYRWYYHAIQ